MRSFAIRLVPILTVVAAGCSGPTKPGDTDEDTDIVNVDDPVDTDVDTDVPDTDDTDPTDSDTGVAPLTLADLAVGDLVVTEFMADTLACADPNGEYIEVFYKGTEPVDLKGLVLSNSSASVTNTATTIVQPGTYALLVRQTAAANCYGLTGDWNYPTLSLLDAGDRIKLAYGSTTFDTVDFSGSDWPDLQPGYAIGYQGETPDATANDSADAWCFSSEQDFLGATADHGLPRDATHCRVENSDTAATAAPFDLMITEVMDYGPDEAIRFVEIYNPNSTDASLDGWELVVYNDGAPTGARIALQSTAVLPAKHTWVVANPSLTAPSLGDAASAPTNPLLVSAGCTADQYSGSVNGDGNDSYALSYRGFLVDVFGVPGVNGAGEPWEYTDKVAYRHDNLVSPVDSWASSEWTITNQWSQASICRFNEAYVPPDVGDSGDTYQDSTVIFDGDTFDTSEQVDTDVPAVFDPLASLAPGELVINEVMFSPSCGDDSQYLEVTLLADHNVSLNGLTLQIDSAQFTFTDLIGMRPGESTLLWRTPNGLPDGNCYFGGLEGLRYSGLNISHTGSQIRLKSGSVVLDLVNTAGLRDVVGVAWQFNPDTDVSVDPQATANNDMSNWCASADSILGTPDFGSPLAYNVCTVLDTADTDLVIDTDIVVDTDVPVPPKGVTELVVGDVVITEFMNDPSQPCADENGEYVEVLNTLGVRVDLQGLVVSSSSGSGTVGASLVLNGGEYAVLRRLPTGTQCFGNGSAVKTANYPANVALNQAGDAVSIGNGLTVLDTVDFSGWAPPSYVGEAWNLAQGVTTPVGNDTASNWCRGGLTIGSQNIGTPGTQLPCAP